MPGNSFFDQIVQAIEQAQKEATAAQRASRADVDKARKEMAREKMKKEKDGKEAKEREEKAKKEKAAENSAPKPLTGEESKSPLGEKFNARKMVIYSEIMNPKYKD